MARIKESDIDALRERASIVDVISGYTKLKKAGGQKFKGLCPFHSEKTPSFTVDSARGLFYCFGCSEGGNLYHFVQKVENLPFPEAVEWVARKAGFDLQYEEMRPGEAKAAGVKARLLKANQAATEFFHKTLLDSPDALEARRYLEGRGFGPEVARRWMLGYAPGRGALTRHLLERGFSQQELEQADLVRRSERDGSPYDNFIRRIVFPTWNLQDDVVGFGARALGDQKPKYLNSAETPVFSKSRVMYGLNRAKSAIARGKAIVVEGYTDVIAMHEAGLTEAVATNGVALGDTHFELLKKFTDRAVLMLDADDAGQKATARSFDIHHRVGIDVLVAVVEGGKDPAEVLKDQGIEPLSAAISSARPLMEFKIDQVLRDQPTDTPEARSRAVGAVIEVLGWHPDPIARHQYATAAAEKIGVEPEGVQRVLAEQLSRPSERAGVDAIDRDRERRLPGHVKVEREALQLLLTRSRSTEEWIGELEESLFTSPARREVFHVALRAHKDGVDWPGLAHDLSADALSLATELTVGAEQDGASDAADRVKEIFTRLQIFRLERDIRTRREHLQGVNPVEEPQRHDELFTELIGLQARRRDLLRSLQGAA